MLHVNEQNGKKNAIKKVKYEKDEAVKVQRGKERVMTGHMWRPGENPRIRTQTGAETLEDEPPQRAQHGTAAHKPVHHQVNVFILQHDAPLRSNHQDPTLIKASPACLCHITQKRSGFKRKTSVSH